MLKFITIAKISDHGGEQRTPTHAVVMSDENYQHKVTIGKLWTKTSTYGKYLSGVLSDEYVNNEGKKYDAYVVITADEYNELKRKAHITTPSPEFPDGIDMYNHELVTDADRAEMDEDDKQFKQAIEKDEVNLDDIPF